MLNSCNVILNIISKEAALVVQKTEALTVVCPCTLTTLTPCTAQSLCTADYTCSSLQVSLQHVLSTLV